MVGCLRSAGRFNGAGLGKARKSPPARPIPRDGPRLQWSRAWESPEIQEKGERLTDLEMASMEPGLGKPGNRGSVCPGRVPRTGFNGAGLGKARKSRQPLSGPHAPRHRFNGAGLGKARKHFKTRIKDASNNTLQWSRAWESPETSSNGQNRQYQVRLQWSRAWESPETSSSSMDRSRRIWLQWSRALESPETGVGHAPGTAWHP